MKKTLIIILAAMMAMPVLATASETLAQSSLTDNKPVRKKKGEVKEVTFLVHLHCENCVKKVQENIAFEKGVKDLHVCLEDQTVEIKYDSAKTSEETLKAAIEELGYKVNGKAEAGHVHAHEHHVHD